MCCLPYLGATDRRSLLPQQQPNGPSVPALLITASRLLMVFVLVSADNGAAYTAVMAGEFAYCRQ